MPVGEYLLEAYMPRTCAGDAPAAIDRACSVVEEMTREGTRIRLLRSIFLAEDELCFCLFEATSIEEVAEVGRRAQMRFGRIQPAIELFSTRTVRASTGARRKEVRCLSIRSSSSAT